MFSSCHNPEELGEEEEKEKVTWKEMVCCEGLRNERERLSWVLTRYEFMAYEWNGSGR